MKNDYTGAVQGKPYPVLHFISNTFVVAGREQFASGGRSPKQSLNVVKGSPARGAITHLRSPKVCAKNSDVQS